MDYLLNFEFSISYRSSSSSRFVQSYNHCTSHCCWFDLWIHQYHWYRLVFFSSGSLYMGYDWTAYSYLPWSLGINKTTIMLLSLCTDCHYCCLLVDLLVYHSFHAILSEYVWWSISWKYFYSLCIQSYFSPHVRSYVPASNSNVGVDIVKWWYNSLKLLVLAFQCGVSEETFQFYSVYTGYIYYYVIFLFPIASCVSWSELRRKFFEFFRIKRHPQQVQPLILAV